MQEVEHQSATLESISPSARTSHLYTLTPQSSGLGITRSNWKVSAAWRLEFLRTDCQICFPRSSLQYERPIRLLYSQKTRSDCDYISHGSLFIGAFSCC